MEVEDHITLFKDIFPFNDVPRIIINDSINRKFFHLNEIFLTDTTLRDGQQGWRNFTIDEGIRIFLSLVELNGGSNAIASSEFFLYTEKDRKLVKELRDYDFKYPKIIGWIRASRNDLRLVIENKLDETVILTSISDYHIYYKLGLTRDLAFRKYLSIIEEALKKGITVRCALEDATRADVHKNIVPFIKQVLKLSEKYKIPTKIKIADTLGLGLPFPDVPPPRGIPALIQTIINETGIENKWIEFHGHNDLGLVIANHLAAWIYGAAGSNCTLLGIGERAGNCPLEIMLIHYAGIKKGNDVNLKAISKIVELFTSLGFKIPEFHPLIGENAFRTKAGIHIDGLMKKPKIYLPFNPLTVLGVPYTISITPYSGRAAIAFWINSYFNLRGGNAISKDDMRIKSIYNEILKIFEENNRRTALSNQEMLKLVSKYFPELCSKYCNRKVGSSKIFWG